jgi:cysteine desulfurase/selenocysteine lyase
MDTTISEAPAAARVPFDPARVRSDFPILSEQVHGRRLVYLDNANTTQKPVSVLEALDDFYRHANANIHRATHLLGEQATQAYEGARAKVARFIGAREASEVVLTRGCTDGLNLVAQCYARPRLRPGDEILVSWMEHHSNIVPWQLVCEQTGARLRAVPISDTGELRLDELDRLLTARTRLVSIVHVSNALGTVLPVRAIVERAHALGIPVVVDGAQAAAHLHVDVQELDCDFFAFSSHKMYGPTGSGALYGKRALFEEMPPYQGGGDMIASVTFEKTTYNALPYKFEAGTPNIAGAVGFGAAVDYLERFDPAEVVAHEHDLLSYATDRVREVPGLRIVGNARTKASVLSFVIDGVHPHDIGTVLDRDGVAIRTGQHCAQPVMDRFGVPATARASFALYNTRDEIDALVDGLLKVREIFHSPTTKGHFYRDVILDHNRTPRNHGRLEHPRAQAQSDNPQCGDRLTVFVRLAGSLISDISFVGPACAIATASASLMTDCIRTRSLTEARAICRALKAFVNADPPCSGTSDVDALNVFTIFGDYPSRLACVTLPWDALEAALRSPADELTADA